MVRSIQCALVTALTSLLFPGCSGGTTNPAASLPNQSAAPADDADAATAQAIRAGLSKVINDAGFHYLPLVYKYDEELLEILDRAEAYLSGRPESSAPRFMAGVEKRPGLSEEEELDHFRETIRRWHSKTGKDLRKEVDTLKAEVASRKPGGPQYYPEFHKHFSTAFDDFIPIEVAEIRERRNQYIHEQIKPLFDKYRAIAPKHVEAQEDLLNKPPYNLPEGLPSSDPEPSKKSNL
jgi:hypothetical protein